MIPNIKEVRKTMLHKDDIVFGVMARAKHEIMAGAYRGESGIIFEYPAVYDGFAEMDIFYLLLKNKGYTVTEEAGGGPDVTRIGIRWMT